MTKLLTSLRLIRGIELGINIQISLLIVVEFFFYFKDRAFLIAVKRTQMQSCRRVLHSAVFIQWGIMGFCSYHTYLKTCIGLQILTSCGHIIIYSGICVNVNILTIFIL